MEKIPPKIPTLLLDVVQLCDIQARLFYLAARKCLTCKPSHVLKSVTLHSELSEFNPAKLILFTCTAAAVTSSEGFTADENEGLEFPCQLLK